MVPFDFKDIKGLVMPFFRQVMLTHRFRQREVQGEEIVPEFSLAMLLSNIPVWLKPYLGHLATLLKQGRVGEVLIESYVRDLAHNSEVTANQHRATAAFSD